MRCSTQGEALHWRSHPLSALRHGGTRGLRGRGDAALREWMGRYLDWLLTSELGKKESAAKNNHATWFDVQAAGIQTVAQAVDFVVAHPAATQAAAPVDREPGS